MDLPGTVAVIEGELYPLRSCDISHDIETDNIHNMIGETSTVVTGVEISGMVESYRSYDVSHLGTTTIDNMYIFPTEDGTRNRVVVKDAIVSGTSRHDDNRTQTIEFIAMDIEADG